MRDGYLHPGGQEWTGGRQEQTWSGDYLGSYCTYPGGLPGGSVVKNQSVRQETWVRSLGWEDTLEKEMATHSSILAQRIPWTEPGGL